MSSKQQQAALLAVAMQLVGCVCAVMLALCAALGVTLMREGHYAAGGPFGSADRKPRYARSSARGRAAPGRCAVAWRNAGCHQPL